MPPPEGRAAVSGPYCKTMLRHERTKSPACIKLLQLLIDHPLQGLYVWIRVLLLKCMVGCEVAQRQPHDVLPFQYGNGLSVLPRLEHNIFSQRLVALFQNATQCV